MTSAQNSEGQPFAEILRVTPASAACNPRVRDELYVRPGALADLLVAMAVYVPPYGDHLTLAHQIRETPHEDTCLFEGVSSVVHAKISNPVPLATAESVAGVVGMVDTIWRFVLEADIRRRRAETLENGG